MAYIEKKKINWSNQLMKKTFWWAMLLWFRTKEKNFKRISLWKKQCIQSSQELKSRTSKVLCTHETGCFYFAFFSLKEDKLSQGFSTKSSLVFFDRDSHYIKTWFLKSCHTILLQKVCYFRKKGGKRIGEKERLFSKCSTFCIEPPWDL